MTIKKDTMMTPFYERDGITIYCGECSQVMRQFDPGSIDLTVTSPPYDNLRTYNGYTFDFEAIAGQLWRVTTAGGVVVWVVGDKTEGFCESLTSFKQAIYFVESCGFNLFDTMIYKKRGLEFPRFNHKNYPSVFEYMFVFSKGAPGTSNLIADRQNNYAGDKIWGTIRNPDGSQKFTHSQGRTIQDLGYRGNIWEFDAGYMKNTKDELAYNHPAIFPEALARDHIISWSNPGDLVLDPMLGSGTTCKMAQQLGRRCIGIEISEEYCKIAVDRLRQPSFFSIPDKPVTVQPEQVTLF